MPIACGVGEEALVWLRQWEGLTMERYSGDVMLGGRGCVPLVDADFVVGRWGPMEGWVEGRAKG